MIGDVLGAALGEDTTCRLEDGGIGIKHYEAVNIGTENRHLRLQSRAAGKAMPKIQTRWSMAWTRRLLPLLRPRARGPEDAEDARFIPPAWRHLRREGFGTLELTRKIPGLAVPARPQLRRSSGTLFLSGKARARVAKASLVPKYLASNAWA